MANYRKKPVVIQAIQWTGGNLDEVMRFLGASYAGCEPIAGTISILTLEGKMQAPEGHYLICGVKGEHYSCEPSIFAATYELVD